MKVNGTTDGVRKCFQRFVFLMFALLMLSATGLGQCDLRVPEVFRNPTQLIMRSLSTWGLG